MFEPRVKNGQTDLLMKALLSLESTDEAYRFFEDLPYSRSPHKAAPG